MATRHFGRYCRHWSASLPVPASTRSNAVFASWVRTSWRPFRCSPLSSGWHLTSAIRPFNWCLAQRPRLLAILVEHLVGLAKRRPVLIIVEDAHWADATTLELVRLLLDRIVEVPLLLVVPAAVGSRRTCPTHRVCCIDPGSLGRAAVGEMVAGLPADRGPPSAALVAAVATGPTACPCSSRSSPRLSDQGRSDAADDEIEVPASLHDALMARLDRLAEAKELAQVAACIGRESIMGCWPPSLIRRRRVAAAARPALRRRAAAAARVTAGGATLQARAWCATSPMRAC